MIELTYNIALSALSIILDSGFWIVLSLIVAGLMHEFVDPEKIRGLMHRSGPAGIAGALGLGAVLPTCSCGVRLVCGSRRTMVSSRRQVTPPQALPRDRVLEAAAASDTMLHKVK